MKNFKESQTIRINSIAQNKAASGIKVFNLSAGEPKLPTSGIIKNAAIQALSQNKTLYPPISGIPELKEAASNWMRKEYNTQFKAENTLVVNGGKLGIFLLLQLLLSEGDEVLIPAPYWVSYPTMTEIFGGKPKIIETHEANSWKLTAADVEKARTNKSKIIIINNGSNPTGTIYTQQELLDILKVAHKYDLFVISDEVYSGLVYDNHVYVSCGSYPHYEKNVAVIQSCSKSFAMSGWRIGFVFAVQPIIKQLTALIGQCTSGVTTISQWAALEAFRHHDEVIPFINQAMLKRRNVIVHAIKEYLGIQIHPPASALYIFLSLKDMGVKNVDSVEFCEQALLEANVAVVPGVAFGCEGYIRLAFGAEEEELVSGVKALASFLKAFPL